MKTKFAVGAAAVAAGIGLSALPLGAVTVHAAPFDPPPPCLNCEPGPGGGPAPGPSMKGPSLQYPGTPEVLPPTGGGPKTGGRSVR